ncbi:MAG: hypothetical protein MK108_02160 [Mariniblastus sp.]|nr:hypothetical protein [Mariniblastus sp.]
MPVPPQSMDWPSTEGDLIQHAVELLSQQVWCWGQDILRPEGNWLIEIGFDRTEPPDDREECSSIYSLELPDGGCVVLRGFGVFYGDPRRGVVFLPRYEFRPRYTKRAALQAQPWTVADLPELTPPTPAQRRDCGSLTLDLIGWIRRYEVNIMEVLGTEYRQSTLERWETDKRPSIRAEEMAGAWRRLGVAFTEDIDTLFPRCPTPGSHPHD